MKPATIRKLRDFEPEIDPAWHLFPLVCGRKAVIVGGDPREPNRERIERAFRLASLDWPAIYGQRKVRSTVESIRGRGYGLVLVLAPFIAHKQSDAIIQAAKATPVPWALAVGYGVSAIKVALERFLGGPTAHPTRFLTP
jgi:hypothetical protein